MTNYTEDPGLIHITELQNKLHTISKNFSIKKWDIGASCSFDSSVQVNKGIAKQLKSSQRNSLTIRVWNEKGLVGITSTSDLSEKGLCNAISAAYEASSFGNAEETPQFSSEANSPLPSINRDLKPSIGINSLYQLLKQAEGQLLSSHKSIDSVPYNGLSESTYTRIYINSEGAKRELKRSQSTLYLYARAEEAGRKPRSSGAVRLALGASDIDIEGCINEASTKTINHLNYAPIETGKYLVCFKPEAFLELINAFSSIFNARSILDGVSLSKKDSIGESISIPSFNLADDGLNKHNIGAVTFDGEGTPTKRINLVEQGIIKNFLHSEATARAFNVKPTGHAGLGSKVSVGPDWFVISSSNNTKSSLNHYDYQDTYVLIESLGALHAGIKASQGSFSLPFEGWLVKGKEMVSVEAATVAGDIRSLLKNIVSIEEDNEITHGGISPHIWIDDLSITGEA